MDDREFRDELERIRADVDDFAKPFSACEYFHGREKRFREEQLREAVGFFLEYQQRRFEK